MHLSDTTGRVKQFATRYAEEFAAIIESEPFNDFRKGKALAARIARDLMALRASLDPAADFAMVRRLDNALAVCGAVQAAEEPGPEDEDFDAIVGEFWNVVEALVDSLARVVAGRRRG